jgi:predicted esterase
VREDGAVVIDLLEHQRRPAHGHPAGALVLLHGRGTNELDLLPLLDELDPDRHIGVSNFDVEQLRRIQQLAPMEIVGPIGHDDHARRVGPA